MRDVVEFCRRSYIWTSSPITKTRFVDPVHLRKLFEFYDTDAVAKSPDYGTLREQIAESDLVIVNDYGHGLIDDRVIEMLGPATFLAINTQANAANYGFHDITRYNGFATEAQLNFVCLNVTEARLALRDRHATPEQCCKKLRQLLRCDHIAITHGDAGSYLSDGELMHVPALISDTVDTMGAGDAFLALAAPIVAASSADLELAGFLGNIAGAIKSRIVGHRKPVDRATVQQYVEALLK